MLFKIEVIEQQIIRNNATFKDSITSYYLLTTHNPYFLVIIAPLPLKIKIIFPPPDKKIVVLFAFKVYNFYKK